MEPLVLLRRWAWWVLPNALLAAGVYFGFYGDIAWAQYATTAFIWLMLVFYVAALQGAKAGSPALRRESRIGFWAGRVFDVAITLALIGATAYVTAFAYAASCFVLYFAIDRHAQVRRPIT